MNKQYKFTPKRIDWLRKRLQKCEQQIISLTEWDSDNEYWGLIKESKSKQLKDLLFKRRYILNQMFDYTQNEVNRLDELNTALNKATKQAFEDFKNLYIGRLKAPNLEEYNDTTCLEIVLYYSHSGSVLKMDEDDYYGSKFSQMLELLCDLSDSDCLSIKSFNVLDHIDKLDVDEAFIDKLDDGVSWADWLQDPRIEHINICHIVHFLFDHHLYSIPDVLRMNHFKIEMKIEQDKDIII